MIEAIVGQEGDPKLLREIIMKLDWRAIDIRAREVPAIDPSESTPNENDLKKLKEKRAKLHRKENDGGA